MAVKFQGHPIVVEEIMMFMLTERIDPEELTKMTMKLDLQKAANTTAPIPR
jgi:hypothetical protein